MVCGYIYANAGEGESTQDPVFGGQNIIAENGTCLVQSDRFKNACICADMDLGRIISERRRMTTFKDEENKASSYETVYFELNTEDITKKDSKKQARRMMRYSATLIRLHLCLMMQDRESAAAKRSFLSRQWD